MAKRMIRNFLEWLSGKRWSVIGVYADADEIPERLGSRDIAIVATPEFTKWIVFDCPCRAGHRIMLNADRSRKPFWELRSGEPAAIWPSIDFDNKVRRCHYVVNRGRTHWAKDSD